MRRYSFPVTHPALRIALLVDPLSMFLEEPRGIRGRWGEHAPELARDLLGRGHVVRGFGAPGLIPHSGDESKDDDDGSTKRLFQSLASFAPDVIVAYDLLSGAAFRGARMARKLEKPLVLVEAAQPERRSLGARLESLGSLLWGAYVRRTASAVVVLDCLAAEQTEEHGFAAELLHEIPHGVDLARFRPGLMSPLVSRHRIAGRIVLSTAPLIEAQGIQCLLGAFAETVGQRDDWHLVIAGEGPRRPELAAAASSLGIASCVHWLAPPREEELPGLMGASTLFAAPALEASNTSRQIARALACGLPVVGSNLPRIASLVRPEETGLLVPPGDQEAWEEALGRAASSPVARRRWSAEARAYAERELGWPAVGARFEELLVKVHERAGERNAGELATEA